MSKIKRVNSDQHKSTESMKQKLERNQRRPGSDGVPTLSTSDPENSAALERYWSTPNPMARGAVEIQRPSMNTSTIITPRETRNKNPFAGLSD